MLSGSEAYCDPKTGSQVNSLHISMAEKGYINHVENVVEVGMIKGRTN